MVQERLADPAAISSFRKVVAANPNSAEAHLNLGIALADQNKKEDALQEFSTAVHLAPANGAAYYNKGRMLADLRRFVDAEPVLEQACRLSPDLADAFFQLGVVERELSHPEASAARLRTAVQLNPRNAEAYFLLGQALRQTGDIDAAIAAWKQAIDIDPKQSQALYGLLRTYAKTNPQEAKAYQARLEALQHQTGVVERAQTLSNFAISAANAGNWTQAVSQLQQAIQECGNCESLATLHKNLGLIECRAGQLEKGEKELRIAAARLPDDAEIQRALEMIGNMRGAAANQPH